jgi:hypothetical protein
MMMITVTESSESRRLYKVEGKLVGPWVHELKHACEELEIPPSCLRLDLGAVSFIDSAGVKLLDELIRRGATIVACSGFLVEMLNLDKA